MTEVATSNHNGSYFVGKSSAQHATAERGSTAGVDASNIIRTRMVNVYPQGRPNRSRETTRPIGFRCFLPWPMRPAG
jgi:hypothetical protein